MKQKYTGLILLLIFLSANINAQNNVTGNSIVFGLENKYSIFSDKTHLIEFSTNNIYAGSNLPAGMKIFSFQQEYTGVFITSNMPSLNELKNSMLERIDAESVSDTRINFQSSEDGESSEKESEGSFFSSNLFYFIGAAVLATTFYIVWQDNQNETPARTFGYPPKPQTDP